MNFDADVKNAALGLFIVATGRDRYQTVISFGEVSADYGNQPILVAYEQDGKPITGKEGPLRLIVPGDKQTGRYVSGLVSLEVRPAPAVVQ